MIRALVEEASVLPPDSKASAALQACANGGAPPQAAGVYFAQGRAIQLHSAGEYEGTSIVIVMLPAEAKGAYEATWLYVPLIFKDGQWAGLRGPDGASTLICCGSSALKVDQSVYSFDELMVIVASNQT